MDLATHACRFDVMCLLRRQQSAGATQHSGAYGQVVGSRCSLLAEGLSVAGQSMLLLGHYVKMVAVLSPPCCVLL